MKLELRPALNLGSADPFGHDQGLTSRMRMPCGPRARLATDNCTANTEGIGALELAGDRDLAGDA